MKRYLRSTILCVLMLFIAFASSSQIFNKNRGIFDKSNKKMIQELLGKSTTILPMGDSLYVDRFKKAFASYWTVNEYNVVDLYDDKRKGVKMETIGASVDPVIIQSINARGNATTSAYPFFVYGKTNLPGIFEMEDVIAAFPINLYYEFDVLSEKFMYKRTYLRIPYMVHTLNEMLNHIKSNGNDKNFYDSIDARSSKIANKTLIIPADLIKEWDVNPNLTALMKGIEKGRKSMKAMMYNVLDESDISFKGKYKIMTDDEIIKLEQSPEASKYSLFLPAIADKKYLMVYDLKTRELLYYEDIPASMKIKTKDFERLNKAVGL